MADADISLWIYKGLPEAILKNLHTDGKDQNSKVLSAACKALAVKHRLSHLYQLHCKHIARSDQNDDNFPNIYEKIIAMKEVRLVMDKWSSDKHCIFQ